MKNSGFLYLTITKGLAYVVFFLLCFGHIKITGGINMVFVVLYLFIAVITSVGITAMKFFNKKEEE